MIYSCRPRDAVVAETLTHSASVEENLERLKTCGSLQATAKMSDTKIAPEDAIFTSPEQKLAKALKENRGRLVLLPVDVATVFKDAAAEPTVVALHPTGGPIMALVEAGQVVCPVGFTIYYNEHGTQVMEYVVLK